MDKQDKVLKALDSITSIINDLKNDLSTESENQLEINNTVINLEEIVNSDKWPEAVNKHLICDPNSEEDKLERARGIIELMIEEDLENLKFLDFGCGQGHCPYVAKEYNTAISVGYDIQEQENWEKFEQNEKTITTTDFSIVEQNGPYDVILLFDVIDHLKDSTPIQILKEIKKLLSENGRVYMRCHPITSRHATHLYHDFNKAYIHFILSKEELEKLNVNSKFEEENNGPMFPIAGYDKFIQDAELRIINRRDITESPETFFKTPEISKRIQEYTGHKNFPEFQMSLQFIDYVLEK